MKKTFLLKTMLLLFVLIVGVRSVEATDFTLSSASSVTKDGITVSFAKGTGSTAPTWYAAGLRLYAKNTITITCETNITAISFDWEKQGDKAFASATANVGNYTHPNAAGIGNWTGSAKSITFTVGSSGQLQLNTFSVTVESAASQFTITPATNNNDWGTVSLAGSAITATPSSGYRVSTTNPYDVSPSDAATVSQTGNVFTVNATADCTVTINFEAIPTFEVTISTPEGGMLTVKNGDETVNSGDRFETGTVLTVTATPDENYNFRNWQAVDASTHTYTASNTGSYTMTEHDVTFNATFDAKVYYNVSWSVNGTITTDKYEEGNAIVFPSDPSDIAGKSFVGWTATAIDGTTNNAPTFVTSATMGTADVTYYAVFANRSGGSETATLTESEITSNFTNTAMAYSDDEKTYNDTDDNIEWKVKGFANKDDKFVQLRKNNTVAYLEIAASSNIDKIILTITSSSLNTNERNDIAKNGAFTGKVLLRSSALANAGDTDGELGLADASSLSGNIIEITPTNNVKTVFVQTTTGARIWGVEVTTNSFTYSNYCTTIAPVTITPSYAASTYVTTQALDFTNVEGLKAYVATAAAEGKITLEAVGAVPAGTPLLLKGTAGTEYTIPLAATATAPAVNMFEAGDGTTIIGGDGNYDFILWSDGLFYRAEAGTLAVGKAYLHCESDPTIIPGGNAPALSLEFGEGTTGLSEELRVNSEESVYYDLSGRRVAQPTKGLYIVNGKKVLVP